MVCGYDDCGPPVIGVKADVVAELQVQLRRTGEIEVRGVVLAPVEEEHGDFAADGHGKVELVVTQVDVLAGHLLQRVEEVFARERKMQLKRRDVVVVVARFLVVSYSAAASSLISDLAR